MLISCYAENNIIFIVWFSIIVFNIFYLTPHCSHCTVSFAWVLLVWAISHTMGCLSWRYFMPRNWYFTMLVTQIFSSLLSKNHHTTVSPNSFLATYRTLQVLLTYILTYEYETLNNGPSTSTLLLHTSSEICTWVAHEWVWVLSTSWSLYKKVQSSLQCRNILTTVLVVGVSVTQNSISNGQRFSRLARSLQSCEESTRTCQPICASGLWTK